MPYRIQKPMRKIKEKYILNPALVEVEPRDEICNEDRKSPAEPEPADRKRRRSSTSLQQHQPSVKKQKKAVTMCTLCSREFDDSEFRRHNKIEHSLGCSHQNCPLMFVDVPSLCQHLKSHQDHHPPAGADGVLGSSKTSTRKSSSDVLCTPVKKRISSPGPPAPRTAGRQRSLSGLSLLEVTEYWRCSQCREVFPSPSRLESHQAKAHKHQCEVEESCQWSFVAISDRLKHHYEAHNVKKQLVQCPVCLEMVDSKSRKSHDQRPHEVSCTEVGCPVRSSPEGIWSHRIKKHNYGRCVNQPAADPVEEDIEPLVTVSFTQPDDVTEEHEGNDLTCCDNDVPPSLVEDGRELKERIEDAEVDFMEHLESEETCKNYQVEKENEEAGATWSAPTTQDIEESPDTVHSPEAVLSIAGDQTGGEAKEEEESKEVSPEPTGQADDVEETSPNTDQPLEPDDLDNSVEAMIHSEAPSSPPAELQTEVRDTNGVVLEEDKTVVGDINDLLTVQQGSVRPEVSSEDENVKLHSLSDSRFVKEVGQSVRKRKIKLGKTDRKTKRNCKKLPTKKAPSAGEIRNKKSSAESGETVTGPEGDDDYNADDEENEGENRRDSVENKWSWNHSKSDYEVKLPMRDIEPLETVRNEENNILNVSTKTIIISEDDKKALRESERVDEDPEEYFDDIDALLGDTSDEDEVNTSQSVSNVAPVVPVVVLESPGESKQSLSNPFDTEHQDEARPAVLQTTTCQLCQISFKRESAMLTHCKKDHDHPCPECGLKFTGEVFLEEHLLKSHNIKPSPVKPSRRRSSEKSKKSKKNVRPLKESIRPRSNTSKKEKSKSKRDAKVQDKECSDDDDSVCAQCHQHFQGTDAFEKHINLEHQHGCRVQGCELSFTTENLLQLHQFETHRVGTKPATEEEEEKQVANTIYTDLEEPSLLELDCSTCGQSFETFQEKKDHDKLHYTPEKLLSSQSIPDNQKSSRSGRNRKPRNDCWKCRKEFSSKEILSQHRAEGHAFSCEFKKCPRAYNSQPELDRHVARRHQGLADSELKGLSCRLCGDKFPDQKSVKVHQEAPHAFTCHVLGCTSKFETKPKLVQHLESQHGIQHIQIDAQDSGYLTTQRSQDNVQIAEWALDWIK